MVGADLEEEGAAGGEARGGFGDEAADEVESLGAAVERGGGIVADFGGEGCDFPAGDVGEVGEDEVELGVVGWKEVGLVEADAVGELVAGGVIGGEGESVGREVGGVDGGGGEFEGEGEGDDAGAGADVEEGG